METDIDQATIQVANIDLVADTNKVTMMALTNPLILDQIFRSLDPISLRSVRLVCRLWADVGASFLGKQGHLIFLSSSDYYCTSPYFTMPRELASFNPKLAKNVTLYINYNCNINCKCAPNTTNLPSTFATVLPSICEKLETLRFLSGRAFEPRLHEMWTTYDFPNLTHITIIATNKEFNQHDGDMAFPNIQQFRPLGNLKVLCLTNFLLGERNPSESDWSSACQGLLNAAPNLEEFTLNSVFYPDLSPCPKLKEFNFQYKECRDYVTKEIIKLDISEMNRMMERCPNSLEKLTLNLNPNEDAIEPTEKLNFRFPNLTYLKLDTADIFKIQDSLNVTNLPKLTHFSINTCNYLDLSKMMANYYMHHTGITSLNVVCAYCAEVGNQDRHAAAKLVTLFPAVKEYSLELQIDLAGDDVAFLSLRAMMQSFGGWELTRGQVNIQYKWIPLSLAALNLHNESDTEVVIAVMEGMSDWRALPNTTLQFVGNHGEPYLHLTDRMRDALLSCRTIKSVTISEFGIDEDTWEDMNAFIEDNNLPVSIPNIDGFW